MRRNRVAALLGLAVIVTVASAHVTVRPAEVTPGSQTFVVRVPTEKPVPTVALRVEFPSGISVSRLLAKQGWSLSVERDANNTITAATWTGGSIGSDEYDEFVFSARVDAAPGRLALKAYQTYQGGEVVAWASTEDPTPADEHPAPWITVVAEASGNAPAAGPTLTSTGAAAGAATGAATSAPIWLSAGALVLAFVALTVALRNGKREA